MKPPYAGRHVADVSAFDLVDTESDEVIRRECGWRPEHRAHETSCLAKDNEWDYDCTCDGAA